MIVIWSSLTILLITQMMMNMIEKFFISGCWLGKCLLVCFVCSGILFVQVICSLWNTNTVGNSFFQKPRDNKTRKWKNIDQEKKWKNQRKFPIFCSHNCWSNFFKGKRIHPSWNECLFCFEWNSSPQPPICRCCWICFVLIFKHWNFSFEGKIQCRQFTQCLFALHDTPHMIFNWIRLLHHHHWRWSLVRFGLAEKNVSTFCLINSVGPFVCLFQTHTHSICDLATFQLFCSLKKWIRIVKKKQKRKKRLDISTKNVKMKVNSFSSLSLYICLSLYDVCMFAKKKKFDVFIIFWLLLFVSKCV